MSAVDNPIIAQTERTGIARYHTWGPKEPSTYINTACDACGEWEAVIQCGKTKLCDACAAESEIKIL